MRRINKRLCLLALNVMLSHFAAAQSQDFLKPTQTGPFPINGLSYVEFSFTGPQSGFTDPVNLGSGYPVPTLDQIVSEIKGTGTSLVKINLIIGQLKSPTDNAYDPSVPFPLPGRSNDVIAFGQKLATQGIPCLMVAQTGLLENIPRPTDRRAFMIQHIPRLVSVAQIAESAGCQYLTLYTDDLEYLAVDSTLVDLWTQAVAQIRTVFSGRLTSGSTWGTDCTSDSALWTMSRPPQIAALQDVFGVGFFPVFTNHPDPTVAELAAAYQSNGVGYNSLQGIADLHTLYGKPLLIWDTAFASFPSAAMCHGELALFELPPGNVWPPVDYQAQDNLYQAFFQVAPKLDPAWFYGIVFDSFDRLAYSWKDTHMAAFLGSPGESLRGKPALQTLTQAYRASTPQTVPANGWWYNPSAPGTYYAVEAENGVVHLGILSYSTNGDPLWSLVRCVRRPSGDYVGTAEQYTGGRALNQTATPPTGIVDGPAVTLVFNGAATATLQIGTQSIPIQRYQFSSQWASPMLNAPRAGWWDQPAQSGRGYFLEVQGNTLFVGALIYNSAGQPTWLTATGPVNAGATFSGTLTSCSTAAAQAPACTPTANTISLTFSAPWRATLTLGQEPSVDLRRYRPTEIGWAGPAPDFPLPNTDVLGLSATVNAASYQQGVAPGMIATIFGTGLTRGVSGVATASSAPLPYSINGTSVLVNGVPAPIFAVANVNGQEQINFQVPWEVQGLSVPYTIPAVSIVVVNNGAVSPAMHAFFHGTFPAIITSDGKQAVAVHSDYSLVTSQNPAHSGEAITLYGTGFGPVTPLPTTGAPAGSSPPSTMNPAPSVTINAHNSTVQFAGLSPGLVGLYQFNVVVPDQVGIGNLTVLFNTGGLGPSLVTIPVQ
jgi:uncharacterized protein (TIGR03437 family)